MNDWVCSFAAFNNIPMSEKLLLFSFFTIAEKMPETLAVSPFLNLIISF